MKVDYEIFDIEIEEGIQEGWYYQSVFGKDKHPIGPFTRFEFERIVKSKRVRHDTLVRYGSGPWRPLSVYYPSMGKKRTCRLAVQSGILILAVIMGVALKPGTKSEQLIVAGKVPAKKITISEQGPQQLVHLGEITSADIFRITNAARASCGLGSLKENATLNNVAQQRLQEILALGQPSRFDTTAINMVARKVGYKFTAIRENIAQGCYSSSEALMDSSLNSRAYSQNILAAEATETGIATYRKEGVGEGEWIIVQIFASPEAAPVAIRPALATIQCIPPDKSLYSVIQSAHKEFQLTRDDLLDMQRNIQREKAAIDGMINATGYVVENYNDKVAQYNKLFEESSQRRITLSRMIEEYQDSVVRYEGCLRSIDKTRQGT